MNLFSGINEVRRIRLLPGELDTIRSASFAFVPRTSNTAPGHPVGTWIGAEPGTYSVRFRVQFPDSYMSSGEGAQREGDWTGDLTTGALSVLVVEPEDEATAEGRMWGEAVDGLQAALKLSPSGGAFTLGEPIQADIQLRNVSGKDIEFTTLNTALPGEIIVRDSAGNRVATGSNLILDISSGLHRYVIRPGEMATIGHPDIAFVAREEHAPSAWNRIALEPGEYTVQVTASIVPFAELGLEGGTFEAPPGDWTGQLTTGALSVLVAPHAEARATPTENPEPEQTDDTTANVHWGEAHQGLQAGIRILATADAHPLNEPLQISLLLRNIGDSAVEFLSRKDHLCGRPKVVDGKGNKLLGNKIVLPHTGWPAIARTHLAPGETVAFHTDPLIFLPSDQDAQEVLSGIPVDSGPGAYTLQYELQLPEI
ncbi:MAG: hypothetical protein Q8N51_13745, partial [Gammaproteobacteria bacterium]|nr:hypothetical protein [Gammaproteobacteria bacterium]